MEAKNPWKTLSSNCVYENNWISVIHHEVLHPSGNPGIYGVVHFRHIAIGVIVLDDDLNTWLVGQYRYPLNTYSWEIPEGGGKPDVPWIDSAQRELLEETGIKAGKWKELLRMHLSNSATDELAVIYLAQGLEFGDSQPEESEELCVKKVPFSELYEQVTQGIITDSLTVAAALQIRILQLEGKL